MRDIAIEEDKDGSKLASWEQGIRFPDNQPVSLKDWEDLVNNFRNGIKKILDFAVIAENLEQKTEDGFTIGDGMQCLAVHNSVHFGKILAIGQLIGAWPPKEENKCVLKIFSKQL